MNSSIANDMITPIRRSKQISRGYYLLADTQPKPPKVKSEINI